MGLIVLVMQFDCLLQVLKLMSKDLVTRPCVRGCSLGTKLTRVPYPARHIANFMRIGTNCCLANAHCIVNPRNTETVVSKFTLYINIGPGQCLGVIDRSIW